MMYAPVLVSPPEDLPVTLEECKAHLRVDHDDEDSLIKAYLQAAIGHLDGWTGILGRCLSEQEWRQDFDKFERRLCIPLWPVQEIKSVTWRDPQGQMATVGTSNYILRSNAMGAYVQFDHDYSFPTNLYETAAVSVTFVAGYPMTDPEEGDPESTVPAPIKAAILLLVGHWYKNREAVADSGMIDLPMAVNSLIVPFRRVGL